MLMVYLVGVLGFVVGFALGIAIIAAFLKDRPAQDLIEDKSLRWSYGIMAWVIAGAFSAVSVLLYRYTHSGF